MNHEEIVALEEKYSSNVYPKRNLSLVKGKDCLVEDVNGKEYLDCVAGHGSVGIGRANPVIQKVLQKQAGEMVDCSEIFYNETRARLMEKLAGIAPGKLNRSFLSNSGTEAVEAALKFARGVSGRKKIVATIRGFHGRSMGALSATWNPKYRKAFEPLVPEFEHVAYNNLEAMEEAVGEDTAAVILEAIQGEGGVIIPDKDYLKGVKEICEKKGALLIVDEVQTGMGRTGKWFACEHFNVEPDIITCAKILGCGYPIGATIIREDFELEKASHGSTFGGNPLACAVSMEVIKFIEENKLVGNSEEVGEYFLGELRKVESEKVREVRGKGLLVAMELKVRNAQILGHLFENGVLALPTGKTIVRFLPPLTFTKEHVDTVVDAVREGLK